MLSRRPTSPKLPLRLLFQAAAGFSGQINRLFHNLNFHVFLISVLPLALLFAKLHQVDLNGYDDAVCASL